jgi:K+-transporting ATPase ATPase C chain
VKYKSSPRAGQLVAPDVEAWFQQDRFQGSPHIVAQWADAHNSIAQAWVTGDPTHAAYVDSWAKTHPTQVQVFVKSNPAAPQPPKAADLAIAFFENFSTENPGRFPSAVTATGADGKPQPAIQSVKDGTDIQSIFFEMWCEDHSGADLQEVPGDLVTTSGSGLDPHITLANAESQLDRVAAKWAADTKHDPAVVRKEIENLLQAKASAPFGGIAGEKLVNVLELNLELRRMYGMPQ